jgi:dCMP deaminase
MKQKFIDYYMDVAKRTGKLSYARRLKVGAIIVKENRILSYGYNGMPAGWDNDCEDKIWDKTGDYELQTKPEVLHAETNAIAKVSSSTESSQGATLFCTHAPCLQCAKLIYQSGINNIYYRDTYRDNAGLEFLEKSGVNVTKYKE